MMDNAVIMKKKETKETSVKNSIIINFFPVSSCQNGNCTLKIESSLLL